MQKLKELRDTNPVGRLQEITRILREPDGCEWDRAQDFHSMREHLLEEASELIDAINRSDFDNMEEELGDVLFLIYFFARLGQELGHFDIKSVAQRVGDKLIRRHPHVFGDVQVQGVADILRNWESIKAAEKKDPIVENKFEDSRVLKRQAYAYLPGLSRAQKIQDKAANVGFDWPNLKPVLAKIHEELGELEAELQARTVELQKGGSPEQTLAAVRVEEELGDLLFSVVNLARHMKIPAEVSLQSAVDKFIKRFQYVENCVQATRKDWSQFSLAELDVFWNQIRKDK